MSLPSSADLKTVVFKRRAYISSSLPLPTSVARFRIRRQIVRQMFTDRAAETTVFEAAQIFGISKITFQTKHLRATYVYDFYDESSWPTKTDVDETETFNSNEFDRFIQHRKLTKILPFTRNYGYRECVVYSTFFIARLRANSDPGSTRSDTSPSFVFPIARRSIARTVF